MTTSTVWALGDYPRVADAVLTDLGLVLVRACDITPGQRVLDVAAGSGNAAIPAAEAGADVVASDITPELVDAGRRAAPGLEWVVADAQALPFADASFDAVISCIGAMFAPDHRATAAELLRVCRPGGTVGLLNWAADGWVAGFFGVLAPHLPPPPHDPSVAWGTEAHVRELLGAGVDALDLRRGALTVDHFATPADMCAFYREHFGPAVAAYAAAGDTAALDRTFLDFATRTNRATPGGPALYELEYLLAVARRS